MKPFSLSDPEISRWLANFVEPEDSLRNPAIVPREMLAESGYTLNGAVVMSPKGMWGWTPKGWGSRGVVADPGITLGILKEMMAMPETACVELRDDHVMLLLASGEVISADCDTPAELNRAILNVFYILNMVPEAVIETVN